MPIRRIDRATLAHATHWRSTATALAVGLVWVGSTLPATAADPLPVEFSRDIRPILSDTCFKCHGPDEAARKADLRLDLKEGAFALRKGRSPIAPGSASASELFRRITAEDADERMPPADSGLKLAAAQIERIRQWIDQGATWEKHWSFAAPKRPAIPEVSRPDWLRNAIDAFVLARLDREGLTPSPEADPTTLVRRVTLDLTGLPPTPAEVDAFVADASPDAYEKLVDRLLGSSRYGEHMAVPWLDAARYADTNGYQSDGERTMWRWRDWVIDAFNHNMPFDRFTIEQIAGDMLPNATLEQRIATGFNRNVRGNAEGGIIPEEYAVEYVVDRVDTTSTVWLGLTMRCARCHDHKYDPLTQEEFYRVFAFFNNVPERGKAVKFGNSPPMIKAPTREQQDALRELEAALEAADRRLETLGPRIATAQADWEKARESEDVADWTYTHGLLAHYPLEDDPADYTGNTRGGTLRDGKPSYGPGQLGQAGRFDGKRFVDAGNVADFGYHDAFSCTAWIYSEGARGGTIVSRMTDTARADGYSLRLAEGTIRVNLVKRWLDDAIRVETQSKLAPNRWHHVAFTYDGSRVAKGIAVYVDGEMQPLKVHIDDLNQSFKTSQPLRIGAGGGPEDRFHGAIDDVRIYEASLAADEIELISTADSITKILAVPRTERTPAQAHKIRTCFLERHAPEPLRQARADVLALRKRKQQLIDIFPTTMVMQERETPRETFVLTRGVYNKPGKKVTPGVPSSLHPLPAGARRNRLGFARWLVDAGNPLAARVAVNRYWQRYFGAGLVRTTEDFGTQGDRPSHPALLDWLATDFLRTGWDVKAMQRILVMSATYRQSSKVTPALRAKDPKNRLLARGPRYRLSAEMLRDQALAASGLLAERIGGPSVKPYQPEGLWKEIATTNRYVQDTGANLYRRSLYTYWKRTVAPPTMMAFDASGREMCAVRRARTNTPLQALALLNDVTFVEAARVLAQRVMTEAGPTEEERIALAFRSLTARRPRTREMRILRSSFDRHLKEYRADPDAARELVGIGETRLAETLDVSELAAYTAVAGILLNLDETITKE